MSATGSYSGYEVSTDYADSTDFLWRQVIYSMALYCLFFLSIIVGVMRYRKQCQDYERLQQRVLVAVYSDPELKRAVELKFKESIGHVPPLSRHIMIRRGYIGKDYAGIFAVVFFFVGTVAAQLTGTVGTMQVMAIALCGLGCCLVYVSCFMKVREPICTCCCCGMTTDAAAAAAAFGSMEKACCGCCQGTGVCSVQCASCCGPTTMKKSEAKALKNCSSSSCSTKNSRDEPSCTCCCCGMTTEEAAAGGGSTEKACCGCCQGTGVCSVQCASCCGPKAMEKGETESLKKNGNGCSNSTKNSQDEPSCACCCCGMTTEDAAGGGGSTEEPCCGCCQGTGVCSVQCASCCGPSTMKNEPEAKKNCCFKSSYTRVSDDMV